MEQSLRDMYRVLDKEIANIAAKGTVSPTEMENAYKAVCTMEKIKKIESMEMNPEFSERRASYNYGVGGYWPLDYEESMRRGRDSMGRYTSMDNRGGMMSNDGRMMRDNYSGHSINDRMIDQLERMMDSAQTQNERNEIMKQIEHIRTGK